MRILVLVFIFIFSVLHKSQSQSDSLTGLWQSDSESPKMYLQIINSDTSTISVLLNVPSQGTKDFEPSSCTLINDSLFVTYRYMNIVAKLELATSDTAVLIGTWSQNGNTKPIQFIPTDKIEGTNRPQIPTPPFNYTNDTIFFKNPVDSIQLHAILSIPNNHTKPLKAAILISGSGASDWDQTILGHKSFWVIADHLASRGIAVLRYHDRGVSSSEGNHMQATSMDLARDAVYAVEYLRSRVEIDPNQVGIIGHSEGGMIAPMSYDMNPKVGFIVSLAGPGENITDLMKKQNMLSFNGKDIPAREIHFIEKFYDEAIELIASDRATEDIFQPLQSLCNKVYIDVDKQYFPSSTQSKEQMYMQLIQARYLPWYAYFLRIKPRAYWATTYCPVLAVNGSKDIQVEAIANIEEITTALQLAKNINVTTHIFEGMNHLFQKCNTCTITEYGTLETTIEPEVLKMVSDWIIKL